MTMVNNSEAETGVSEVPFGGIPPLFDGEKERDHQALLSFMRLLYLVKQAQEGVPVLHADENGALLPEHIVVFTTEGKSPHAEAEEARRQVFVGKVGALSIVEPQDEPLDTVMGSTDKPLTQSRAIGAFSGHVLVETVYYLKNSDSVAGYAYDVHPVPTQAPSVTLTDI